MLFSLSTPLLFMGEEHDERAPFQFFTDHNDPAIAEATREGRKREFAAFASFAGEEVPDPQARGDLRALAASRSADAGPVLPRAASGSGASCRAELDGRPSTGAC